MVQISRKRQEVWFGFEWNEPCWKSVPFPEYVSICVRQGLSNS